MVLDSCPDGLDAFAGQVDPEDLPAFFSTEDRNGYPDIFIEFRMQSIAKLDLKNGLRLKSSGFIDGFYGYECNNNDCQYA
jgi:hypothetical protein